MVPHPNFGHNFCRVKNPWRALCLRSQCTVVQNVEKSSLEAKHFLPSSFRVDKFDSKFLVLRNPKRPRNRVDWNLNVPLIVSGIGTGISSFQDKKRASRETYHGSNGHSSSSQNVVPDFPQLSNAIKSVTLAVFEFRHLVLKIKQAVPSTEKTAAMQNDTIRFHSI